MKTIPEPVNSHEFTAKATPLLLPVLIVKNVWAWPGHEQGGEVAYQPPASALRTRYATDAHTAGYSVPTIHRRLDKGAPGQIHHGRPLVVPMVVRLIDVDTPHHAPATDAWRAEENAKIARLFALHPGFAFHSRGGYKIAWRLAVPFLIASDADALAWRVNVWRFLLFLSRIFGIEGDPTCSDWTRLYRLPHTTRLIKIDGREVPGDAPEELPTEGDPELAPALIFEPDPADLALDLAEARRLAAMHPAVKDSAGKTTVAGRWDRAVKALASEAGEGEPGGDVSSLPLQDAPPATSPGAVPPPRTSGPRPAPSSGTASPRGRRPTLDERQRLWAEKALARMTDDLARTTSGGRNAGARDAGLVLGHYAPHLLSRDAIERALMTACERNGVVREDGRDAALTTIRSAISDGMREPKWPALPADEPRRAAQQQAYAKEHEEHGPASGPQPTTRTAPLALDPWAFPTTDTGNAERLAAHHGSDLRYCHPWQKWLTWDGRRWAEDDQGAVKRSAKQTARSIYAEASAITGSDDRAQARRKDLAGWARRSEARPTREAMISLAQSEPGIPIIPKSLDCHPWLLNVENGTLDLRTFELQPHRRGDLITKIAPVVYDPAAEAPAFRAFLETITGGDTELQKFLQKFFGYCLTGETTEHVLILAYGTGSNGKTTLLRALMHVMGDYAYQAPADLIMAKKGETHPTDQAGLFGRRLAVCMETPEGRSMDEARMKALTGGDLVTARRMREDFWTFEPTHKLILATNHRPHIRTTDHGTWRRQKIVPFTVQIPDDQQDKTLPAKLRAEASGLLRWAVEGCLAWQREGLGEPGGVSAATQAWRDESDPLAAFLAAECEMHAGGKTEASVLYAAYARWTAAEGGVVMTPVALGRRLAERGLGQMRTKVARYWTGVQVKPGR